MKVCVLSSGSGGNCTLIESGKTKILVDLGTSSLYAEKRLREINIEPEEIDGIFITHTHVDHIKGIKVFLKKYNTKLYLSEIILKEIYNEIKPQNYEIIDSEINLNDFNVTMFKISHDTEDANGFIFESNGRSVVYVTDTGYLNIRNHKLLTNRNMYVFESNHDVEMLMNGHYPYHIKQRILGDTGHLSNKDSAYYLSKFVGNNTKCVILAHLSKDNNTKELALETLQDCLKKCNKDVEKILIAEQDKRTELIEV